MKKIVIDGFFDTTTGARIGSVAVAFKGEQDGVFELPVQGFRPFVGGGGIAGGSDHDDRGRSGGFNLGWGSYAGGRPWIAGHSPTSKEFTERGELGREALGFALYPFLVDNPLAVQAVDSPNGEKSVGFVGAVIETVG